MSTKDISIDDFKEALKKAQEKNKKECLCKKKLGSDNGLQRIQIEGGNIKTCRICKKFKKEV